MKDPNHSTPELIQQSSAPSGSECSRHEIGQQGQQGTAALTETIERLNQEISERRRIEESLRESEERYRRIIETANEGVLVADADNVVTFVNKRLTEILGYAQEEMLGVPATEFLLDDDSDYFHQKLKARRRGESGSYELRVRRKDGGICWFLISATPMIDAQGNFTGAFAMLTDITARKQAEQTLRDEREFTRILLENLADGVVACDAQAKLVLFNRMARQWHGVAVAELPPEQWPSHYDLRTEDGSRLLTIDEVPLARAFRGERVRDVPMSICARGRPTRYVITSGDPFYDAAGNKLGAVIVMHDITERRLAEDRLRRNEELYRSLVENIHLGITLVDKDYRVRMMNSLLVEMIGRTKEEWLGRPCYTFLETRDSVCEFCPGTRAMATGRPAEVEIAATLPHGGTRPVRIQAFPTFDENHEVTGFIEVVEDITDRKSTEDQLRQAKDAAEAANRAKSAFLANMSHELRTPMTAILGFTDLLLLPNLPRHEQQEFLETIQRNGKALLELINDVLDLSRIETGNVAVQKTDCVLEEIIEDAVATAKVRAVEKGLELRVDRQGPLPDHIHTDPLRLRQILVNLLGNAVKFTERGEISLSVQLLLASTGPARMQFTVADTGIGIPSQAMFNLFQPFMQSDSSASRRHGGTGLGLAISKHLANALGGDIEVASELGQGSRFVLTIEVGSLDTVGTYGGSPASPTANVQASYPNSAQSLSGRVLLAEDVSDIQVLVARTLRGMNLQVDVAENGKRACEMAAASKTQGKPYDIILMDIQMPGMNGYEATQWLRHHNWQGPIVAVTAHAMIGDREKCEAAGCDDYIAKPLAATVLRDILARYLPKAPTTACAASRPEMHGESVAELVQTFVKALPSRANNIEDALGRRDIRHAAELSHQLKGTAAVYGFPDIANLANAVYQQASHEDDLTHIQTTMAELSSLCRRTAEASVPPCADEKEEANVSDAVRSSVARLRQRGWK